MALERAASLVSSLGFRRAKLDPERAMTDEEYVAAGKMSNSAEISGSDAGDLFELLHEEEGFGALLDVPFAMKHLEDLHVTMRHAVAVAGERREELVRHPLFALAFSGFALGFGLGMVQSHRTKQLGLRISLARLSKKYVEQCIDWGVEITTYYLAYVDTNGIFGKDADASLYGIADRWRLVADERRLDSFEHVSDCVEAGRRAATLWFDDDTADVPPFFFDALTDFIGRYQDRDFA